MGSITERKNPETAKRSLLDALSYNKKIPIAHYRLG